MIGAMTMPEDFKYKDVLLAGKPVHTWNDPFRLKHPSMPNARRAKIFSPFDALEGFSDAVASKEVLYEFRRELSDEQREQLGRKFSALGSLTANSRMARANRVRVTVTYFVPCSDTDMDSYGYRGRYVQCAGLLRKVSQQAVQVEDTIIPLSRISRPSSAHRAPMAVASSGKTPPWMTGRISQRPGILNQSTPKVIVGMTMGQWDAGSRNRLFDGGVCVENIGSTEVSYLFFLLNSDWESGKLLCGLGRHPIIDPDDMHYKELADKVRYFKEDEKGVATMCAVMEEMRNEAAKSAVEKDRTKNALEMLADGLSIEKVAQYSHLGIERVKELAMPGTAR